MSDSKNQETTISDESCVDVALIGAGIMSATLGAMLRELEPEWSQIVIERLDAPAMESSSPWNNAGTGHSALCELNYTPETETGEIDITKALGVNKKFQISRQFWSSLIEENVLGDPTEWIRPVPHVSFAHGDDQVRYLKKRYEALRNHPLFPNMEYTEDRQTFDEMFPLMGRGRPEDEKVAVSWTTAGTDINYGALTKQFLEFAQKQGTKIKYGSEVTNIKRDGQLWKLTIKNRHTGDISVLRARFVFVGAGGMALPLLEKSGIPEIKGWGGFPVSGQWLRCINPEIIEQHSAKVYGKASVGAPPMSVPHLDTRVINGEKGLLFGPYAGWTPKFLKQGSWLDLFKSIRPSNILSYLAVAAQEFGLTKYLVTEVLKNQKARMETLREYVPEAKDEDWELIQAGQRVQAIEPVKGKKISELAFGTSLINSADGSIAGILGASPGASIAPAAMLELVQKCFPEKMPEWEPKIKEMIPSYGEDLATDHELFDKVWDKTQKTLKLDQAE